MSQEYKLDYDGESGGPFTEGENLTFSGGAVAELILLYDNGSVGEMYIALISGNVPANNETITGGTSGATADVNGTPFLSRFPGKIRDDTSYTVSSGNIRWTGPALGTTHSCKYDAESGGPFTVGETLTFGNGSTAELTQLTDNGLTGELFFRMIDVDLPADNDSVSGGTSGASANVDGAVLLRAYTPNNVHYWYSDKGDDESSTGDDQQDRTRPRVSRRIGVTDVEFLGNANIDDTLSYHLYGGSISQSGGDDEYNACSIAIVDADGTTQPVIIQNAALLSATTGEYWKDGFVPDAASRINILIKVRAGGVTTDRRVVRFRALEYGRQYFTAPDATLSGGITPVSLVATDDGNNNTAAGTVAGYTNRTNTYGYQTVDHNNGNGAQPYWIVGDLGPVGSKLDYHERFKWEQRRGTSETIFGVNQQLIVGNDLDVPFDGETGTGFVEGETLTFGNGGTALLLAVDNPTGPTGTLWCQRLTGDAPGDNDTITGAGSTANVQGTPVTRLIINNLVGVFTGAAFNPGNNGFTLEAADATAADLFFDLAGGQQQPPNNQSGVVNTDNGNIVTVYPYDGVATDPVGDPEPDFDFSTVATTALTGVAVTSVEVNAAIPSWVPQVGFLRITLNSGAIRLVPTLSYSGSTYTIPSTDFSGDNANIGNGVMPSPIDEEVISGDQVSFTGVYTSDVQFVGRVTRGSDATPKQPFTFTTTFGAGGFTVNVTLQDD